jgi:hypothetical protein
MSVVPSTEAKNQQQDDDQYQHFSSSFLLNLKSRPTRLEAGASARSRLLPAEVPLFPQFGITLRQSHLAIDHA